MGMARVALSRYEDVEILSDQGENSYSDGQMFRDCATTAHSIASAIVPDVCSSRVPHCSTNGHPRNVSARTSLYSPQSVSKSQILPRCRLHAKLQVGVPFVLCSLYLPSFSWSHGSPSAYTTLMVKPTPSSVTAPITCLFPFLQPFPCL